MTIKDIKRVWKKLRKVRVVSWPRFITSMLIITVIVVGLSYGMVACVRSIADDSVMYKGVRYERISDRELVGYYRLAYKYPDGTRVFDITTPRGMEKVVGCTNLQASLDAYRDDGIYGLTLSQAYDIIYRKQLQKWYGI